MKRCPYCGQRFPDEASVCSTDGTTLVPHREATPQNPTPDTPQLSRPQACKPLIGSLGYEMIFAGVAAATTLILLTLTKTKNAGIHGVSEKALPWVLYFGTAAILVTSVKLLKHLPRRLAVSLGIAGWVLMFSILAWLSWFKNM